MKSSRLILAVICVSALLAGCGSGGTDIRNPSNFLVGQSGSPGGVWTGTLGGGLAVAVITEDGKFHILADNGYHYFGSMTSDPAGIRASVLGVSAGDTTLGSGDITGTLTPRSKMTGTFNFTPTGGARTSQALDLSYDALYDDDSKLETIAENYTSGVGVLNVTANGLAYYQEPDTGCVFNGTFDILEPTFNVYLVEYTYGGCNDMSAEFNGRSYAGIAVFDDAEDTDPPEPPVLILMTNTFGGTHAEAFVMQVIQE